MIKVYQHVHLLTKSNNMKSLKLLIICMLMLPLTVNTQKRKNKSSEPTIKLTDSLFHGLKWRNIGPFRGGRSVTSLQEVVYLRLLMMESHGKISLIIFLKQDLSVLLLYLKVIQT
jgi:hypothetical protein